MASISNRGDISLKKAAKPDCWPWVLSERPSPMIIGYYRLWKCDAAGLAVRGGLGWVGERGSPRNNRRQKRDTHVSCIHWGIRRSPNFPTVEQARTSPSGVTYLDSILRSRPYTIRRTFVTNIGFQHLRLIIRQLIGKCRRN